MASRRMFARSITDSDAFLDIPLATQALYVHLCMNADDDGLVNNPKRIARAIGSNTDEVELLAEKGFVISFKSGVISITHWKVHNYIPKDRYNPSVLPEKNKLLLDEKSRVYSLCTDCIQDVHEPVYSLDTDCIQNVYSGKTSLGEKRVVQTSQEQGRAGQERGIGENPHSRNLNRIEFSLDENFSFSQEDKETVISQLQDLELINRSGLDLLEQHKGNPAELLKAIEARQEDLRLDS